MNKPYDPVVADLARHLAENDVPGAYQVRLDEIVADLLATDAGWNTVMSDGEVQEHLDAAGKMKLRSRMPLLSCEQALAEFHVAFKRKATIIAAEMLRGEIAATQEAQEIAAYEARNERLECCA